MKIFTLFSTDYHVSTLAYDSLKKYKNNIKKYLNDRDENEMFDDIMQRLAEKLSAGADSHNHVTEKYVIQAINQLGEPEEMFLGDEQVYYSQTEKSPQKKKNLLQLMFSFVQTCFSFLVRNSIALVTNLFFLGKKIILTLFMYGIVFLTFFLRIGRYVFGTGVSLVLGLGSLGLLLGATAIVADVSFAEQIVVAYVPELGIAAFLCLGLSMLTIGLTLLQVTRKKKLVPRYLFLLSCYLFVVGLCGVVWTAYQTSRPYMNRFVLTHEQELPTESTSVEMIISDFIAYNIRMDFLTSLSFEFHDKDTLLLTERFALSARTKEEAEQFFEKRQPIDISLEDEILSLSLQDSKIRKEDIPFVALRREYIITMPKDMIIDLTNNSLRDLDISADYSDEMIAHYMTTCHNAIYYYDATRDTIVCHNQKLIDEEKKFDFENKVKSSIQDISPVKNTNNDTEFTVQSLWWRGDFLTVLYTDNVVNVQITTTASLTEENERTSNGWKIHALLPEDSSSGIPDSYVIMSGSDIMTERIRREER